MKITPTYIYIVFAVSFFYTALILALVGLGVKEKLTVEAGALFSFLLSGVFAYLARRRWKNTAR